MQKKVVFHIPTYSTKNSAFPRPYNDQYVHWVPLLKYYLKKANGIEFHCWNEEKETISEIQSFQLETMIGNNITIFKGDKTESLSSYLLTNYLNCNGELKWFTVNLFNNQQLILHSSHWGTEFYVPKAVEPDYSFMRNVTPIETTFHVFS